ncbi:MAG: prolyl oligopeptidase family serine peptidase [Phenylobacterium sp.]|nr:prolyl oligopeptidase family serine peptidase [Phenylobacterium sp.]
MRVLALRLAMALACLSAPALARPFTVEDLLAQASLGAAVLDPTGRWLVFEQRDAYASADRFDAGQGTSLTLGRLRIADARAPAGARALLADDPRGVLVGGFSPSGARLAVFRLTGHTWRLGIVSLPAGTVRWSPIAPEDPGRGRALQWLDDRRLLVLARPDGRPPRVVRQGWVFAERLPPRWAASARGGVARTAYGSGAYAPVRVRRQPDRLTILDAETGDARVLAEGAFFDLELSPDRRRVALLASGPDLQPRGDGPVRGAAGSETEATQLSILDLRSGTRATPCPSCDVSPDLLSWSPSGRRLLVYARGPDRLWTDGRLMIVDAARNAVAEAPDGLRPHLDLNPVAVWTAWMGEDPLVFGRRPGGGRDDWWRVSGAGLHNLTAGLPPPDRSARLAGRDALNVVAGGALWRVGPDGRRTRRLDAVAPAAPADGRFGSGTRLRHAPPPALWVVAAGAEGGPALVGMDASGRQVRLPIPAGDGAWADANLEGVAVRRAVDAAGVETLSRVDGAGAVAVARVNAGWEGRETPRVVAVRHAGPAGRPLTSWVFLPQGAGPAPLIVRPYLGSAYPQPPRDPVGRPDFLLNLRVLTGRGYAVLVPSLPNPPGGMTEPAAGLADRILDVVRAALDTPALAGRLDPDRMALMGFSFGGYTVMEAITQTPCFKAAVSIDGISDFTAYWASLPAHLQLDAEAAYWSNWHTGVVEETQPEFHAPPWKAPDRYVRNSPLYAADRIETPLLLIHGAQDGLPLAQSEAMYSALYRQGKDALLLVYWAAMHAPVSPGDVRDVYARTFAFLDDQLGPTLTSDAGPAANPGPGSASTAPRPPSPSPTGCPAVAPSR